MKSYGSSSEKKAHGTRRTNALTPANRAASARRSRNIKRSPGGRTPTRRPNIVTVRKKAKTPFPAGVVFSCVVITSLLLLIMVYFAEIDKLSNQMTALNNEVTVLKAEERKLQERLDQRDDIDMIKKRAIELGMISSELLEHEYVNLTNEDKTEIVEVNDEKGGFGFMLSGIKELFEDFFND